MAGEFEEPYSISFQTDSLHSGSISFGRFESEELSWERRSSFSHNRYLDEVEKYSKPGSVIEKKAYFEAHFKKKGMRLPGSFEGQNGMEYHSENAVFENVGQKEEDDNANESSSYPRSEESAHDTLEYTEFNDEYARGQFDHTNSCSKYAHFNESPEGSEYHGECEVKEYGKKDPGVLASESQMEAALANGNVLVGGVFEDIKPHEAQQTETGYDNNDRQEMGMKGNLNDNTAKVDGSSRPIDPSPDSGTVGSSKTTSVYEQNLSPEVGSPTESKCGKSGLKSQDNSSQVQRSNHSDASKTTMKKLNRKERESPQKMKSEKSLPQAAFPTRQMQLRTLKREDSEIFHSRSNLANKSDREPKIRKSTESETSGSKKVEPRARQRANGIKQTVSSTNWDTRTSTAAFSFRSDKRAERRKEFYMKLEEKMHAKEAEMNHIQAKTQEKTEAEIKQFRKSLNFKATPMPSFYHAATQPGFNGNKATLSKAKAAKIQQKSTTPGSGAASRSQLLSKSGNNHDVSGVESVRTADLPESLGPTDCHEIEISEAGETLSVNSSHHPEALVKSSGAGKDSEKVKDSNLQRQHQRMVKCQRTRGLKASQRMGNGRTSSEMVRKGVESVGIGSSSGMGSVAVGVTS